MFDYFNVRVYDDEKTNLLKHWDNTFRYITRAKAEGSKVLVHCKMGVSRSASVVIAYAMKAYNWEFQQALQHVKARRSCIKPNKNFLNQLETYRGMLDAMKNKEKLQRSKSETNLKSTKDARLLPGSEPTPLIQALNQSTKSKSAGYEVCLSGDGEGEGGIGVAIETVPTVDSHHHHRNQHVNISAQQQCSHMIMGATTTTTIAAETKRYDAGDTGTLLGRHRQRRALRRSSSTSPKIIKSHTVGGSGSGTSSIMGVMINKQQSQSLENLTPERSIADEPKNMRFPGSNGENYSVTQNQVLHIQKNTPPPPPLPPTSFTSTSSSSSSTTTTTTSTSVRTIINDLETHGNERKTAEDRKILNLPFGRSISHDNATTSTTTSTISFNNNNNCYNDNNNRNEDERDDSPIWTSSAKLITQTNRLMQQQQRHQQQREDALIQATEKRYRRKTHSWAASSSKSSSSDGGYGANVAECNIVMEEQPLMRTRQRVTRDLPTRHASWGSGDQQRILPPIRNSSWGSYDTNKKNNTSNNTNNSKNNNNATFYCPFQYSPVSILFEGQVVNNELTNKSYKTAPHDITSIENTLPLLSGGGTVKRTKQKLLEESSGSSCTQKKLRNNSQLYRSASAAGATTNQPSYTVRYNSQDDSADRVSDSITAQQNDEFHTAAASVSDNYTVSSEMENKHLITAFSQQQQQQPTNLLLDNNIEADDTSSQETAVILRANTDVNQSTVYVMNSEDQRISAGNVQILKKNFEARANTTSLPTMTTQSASYISTTSTTNSTTTITATSPISTTKKGHHSLPSSPIAEHNRGNVNVGSTITTSEKANSLSDANVKVLVHKYQKTGISNITTTTTATATSSSSSMMTPIPINNSIVNFKPRPRSYYDNVLLHKTITVPRPLTHEYNENRPPPAPTKYTTSTAISTPSHNSAAVSTNINTALEPPSATAHRRLPQHGKTHPLSRLGLPKQNINAAAYNTM